MSSFGCPEASGSGTQTPHPPPPQDPHLNILFAIVEMSPLVKVGGLADVAGSLPRALRGRGADVRVAMPLHGAIDRAALDATVLADAVPAAWLRREERVRLWQTGVRDVPVYLIENERYFGRPQVYGYDDDVERMLFYCDALLACAPHLGFRPDVIHAHDWHAALLLSRLAAAPDHAWGGAGRVYTIHNLALRGDFDGVFAANHGLRDEELRPPDGLPSGIAYSAMAQGILHTGCVTTVSETYAREILTPEYGAGLDPLLRARQNALSGIVNGIDYEEYNPQTDASLVRRFGVETLAARLDNKRSLQYEAGLPVADDTPLFGVVTRLFHQKGIDIALEAFEALLPDADAQLVVLGTGDADVEAALSRLEERFPRRVKVWFEFNYPLGQRIYAGCDIFLMPSRYEPCGLGQLIALRYGAVPLVRRTGGLRDTVEDGATGFVFDAPAADEFRHTAERAMAAYRDRAAWRSMQERGMKQDWSWGRAAGRYIDLYEQASTSRHEPERATRRG